MRFLRDVSIAALILLLTSTSSSAQATAQTNNFNWANPNTTLSAGTFGQIRAMAGEPRVLQFGVKYGF